MSGTPAEIPTRREYVRGGGAVLAGGLLAGCAGAGPDGGSDGSGPTTGGDGGGTYSVTMSPMGSVEFDAVPESLFVGFPQYADMAVALGRGDDVNSVYVPEMSGKTMNTYYDRLDGVSFEWEGLPDPLSEGVTEEALYELDSDVHFLDPAYLSTQDGWGRDDIEAVAENVGPLFGNFYSGTHERPPKPYREGYRYYTLWEVTEKVAAVLRERERYRALAAIRDDLLGTIRSNLPPTDERPTAARVTFSDGTFYAYHLNGPGYWAADTRPLGARDAFADRDWTGSWGTLDYEAILEADPDVVLHLWGVSPGYYVDGIRETIADHPVGGKLSAIRNDRFYAGGMRYQGPIMNLFQLEMTAKQLYPERFGEWPGYVAGEPYPEIPPEERLFDRTRLSNAVTGDR